MVIIVVCSSHQCNSLTECLDCLFGLLSRLSHFELLNSDSMLIQKLLALIFQQVQVSDRCGEWHKAIQL